MTMLEYHLKDIPIPEGYQIFEERLEVAGIAHRKTNAVSFIRGKNLWLELDFKPSNEYDKNASTFFYVYFNMVAQEIGMERGPRSAYQDC